MCFCRWIQRSSSNSNGNISLKASKYIIILIDSLHLKFKSVNYLSVSWPAYQYLFGGAHKNIHLEDFLEIFIKRKEKQILRRVPCFQHVLLSNFRRVVWSMKIMLWRTFTQYSGSCLKLRKPHCKNFKWKYIKNESQKSYLGDKE